MDIDKENTRIGVVGAGSWGTALANLLAVNGFEIDLWVYETDVCDQITNERENKVFLPGFTLEPNLNATNDIEKVVRDKDILLLVVPSHLMRETGNKISKMVSKDCIIVTASKGIENVTHLTMVDIIKETIGHIPEKNLCVLSGPSFAKEVAQKLPTVVTVASKDIVVAEYIQHIFANPYFRVYTNNDTVGVELGGAIKNVIAIAAGITDGLGLGLNTRAALITRGLVEMKRLGDVLGANPHTFAGLSGVGDLLLTCTGSLSRNHTVGFKLGSGKKLKEILSEMRMVAEGVKTTKSVYNLSKKLGIELPICDEIYNIIYNDEDPAASVQRLMTRALNTEIY
jgi:glycerol-3-phosphate dehydrogenase (NAD(P)+)